MFRARSGILRGMKDVLVLGGGLAGLATARVCAEAGLSVVVLEASDRVGGRIRTVRASSEDGKEVIELGAEFVHGRAAELWDLIEEAGLATYERVGAFLHKGKQGLEPLEGDEEDATEGLKDYAGPDCSFAEYVGRLGLSAEVEAEEVGYVEGFNAADAREASVLALARQQVAEDAIEGERSWRVTEGYDRVPQFLAAKVRAAGGQIVLGAAVEQVTWAAGSVLVRCVDGQIWTGHKAVITLPLGVLQAGVVRFAPAPSAVLEAAGRMRMGRVCRFTMVFKRRLWPEEMSFLIARELMPSVWWTARPSASLSLTGWVGGPRADALLALSAEDLRTAAVRGVATAFAIREGEMDEALVGFYTHDWQEDGWSRGAYSWVPVGGLDASAAMSVPVEDTLFFAGEHTDTSGHWGTVHAALRSGLRAGRQVLG